MTERPPDPPKPLAGAAKKRLFYGLARVSNALFGPELSHRLPLLGVALRGAVRLFALFSPAHRRQRRFERAHPDAPWFVPASLPFIERLLEPGFVGFEWGAGKSTAWFAARVARLVSVESDPAWSERVQRRLDEEGHGNKVELHLVSVAARHGFSESERAAYVAPIAGFPEHHFDFILIDGLFRRACLAAALSKLRPGGYLIVDNADIPDLAEAIAALAPYRIAVYSNAIWETAVYRAPEPGGMPAPGRLQ